MKNAAILCAYNTTSAQLELTKAAVASVFAQDVDGGVKLWILNNGSTVGTQAWMDTLEAPAGHELVKMRSAVNQSPVKIANAMLATAYALGHQHVLGLPNDVVLPPNTYAEFLKWPRGIVTATMTSERDPVQPDMVKVVCEHTPLAVALIRKWCHDALVAKDGFFLDPRYFNYCSDCDWALRFAACGMRGVQLDLRYWHHCSATMRLADPVTAKRMHGQGDSDRAQFLAKWGFAVDSPKYGESCGDINFRGEGEA